MSFALRDVSFAYSSRRGPVLDGLTWAQGSGLTAMLGPNGAGKSTAFKLLCGLLRPSSGSIEVAGTPVGPRSRLGAVVGYLPQDPPAIPGFTVIEQVSYNAWLSGLGRRAAATAATRAVEAVNLGPLGDRSSTSLSGGQRRRLGIACAIAHDPQILFLDEPTAGLDPIERESVEELMATVISAQTVIASTHEVDNVSDVFDSVAICYDGKILSSAPLEDYRALTGAHAVQDIDWRKTYRLIVQPEQR